MCRLIGTNAETCQDLEPEGQEYGSCVFEELPNVTTMRKVPSNVRVAPDEIMVSSVDPSADLQVGITYEQLCQLLQQDPFCKGIMSLLKSSKLQTSNPYYIEYELLRRNITGNKVCFHTMVLPWGLMTQTLRAALEKLGYNGSNRTNILVHKLYYWKGRNASVNKHIKQCMICQKRNIQVVKYAQLQFSTLRLPMQFISMDLIEAFDPSSNGYHYALMVICMLTGYTFCISLKTQTASEVVQEGIYEVYAKLEGP